MPGSATLGSNLVDSLLSVVDDLRGSLHPAMGVRQWRVFVRLRTWSGGRVGAGSPTDVDTELLPQPLVESDDRYLAVESGGLDEMGSIMLSEISLTYTEDELDGGSNVAGREVLYVLSDALGGQALSDRLYQLMEPPKPDRVKTIGWVVKLRRSTEDGCP